MSKQTKKRHAVKKGVWFVRVRGSYLPASREGWLLYIPYILLLLIGFYPMYELLRTANLDYVGFHQTAIGLALSFIMLVPYCVAIVVAMNWIAARKS